MRFKRLIDFHLADRRTDAGNRQSTAGKLRFDLAFQGGVKIQNIFARRSAQLKMGDAELFEHSDLLRKIGGNFIRKSSKSDHVDCLQQRMVRSKPRGVKG